VNRRKFLSVLAAAAGSGLPSRALTASADLRSAAREAWIFCAPLIESARVRAHAAEFAPSSNGGDGINAFIHYRGLATPAERLVTSPNVDTLYSLAFIDLRDRPATVSLPASGKRYFSLHLMDMYTNNFAVLGPRTLGGAGGAFVFVGPHEAARAGAIRAPTPWIWALVRIGVNSPEDVGIVHEIQDAITLSAAPARPQGSFAQRESTWQEYFSSASALLTENPPLAADEAQIGRLARLGLGPSRSFDAAKFTESEAAAIEAGVAEAKGLLEGPGTEKAVNGWRYPRADLGDFGQDYLFRARVAIHGLAALPRHEAMYMHPVTPSGTAGFGDGVWRLNFPPGQLPPVDGFWSLTMYHVTPEGQLFLTENPLRRYAIGDRTKGLKHDADGSLDIWIARQDPGSGRIENWLPAPAAGPYRMTLRAYLPKPDLLTGAYLLPPIEPDE
jgi:hypothetical protein